MTAESSQSWYVKASFGTEWGPMSLETLREMADNGALARDDLARCGVDGPWQPVLTVLDQLPTSDAAACDNPAWDVTPTDAVSQTDQTPEPLSAQSESEPSMPAKPHKRRLSALPNWSNYWGSASASTSLEAPVITPRFVFAEEPVRVRQASLLDSESRPDIVDRPRPAVDNSDTLPSDEAKPIEEFAELDAWKRERAERLERLLNIVREREAAQAARDADAAHRAAQAADTTETKTCDESTSSDAESPLASPPSAKVPSAATKSRRGADSESWEQTLDRWKRSLPHPRSALALLLVPLALWWFWPSSDVTIAATYRLMYFELLELRERPNDKTGMTEFVERSQAELDKLIPGLERRASPNRPEVQWLLWMGRDCLRPMLKQPRQLDTKPELTFNKLMREWQRLHEPNSEQSEDSSIETSTTDSRNQSQVRTRATSTVGELAPDNDVDSDK